MRSFINFYLLIIYFENRDIKDTSPLVALTLAFLTFPPLNHGDIDDPECSTISALMKKRLFELVEEHQVNLILIIL